MVVADHIVRRARETLGDVREVPSAGTETENETETETKQETKRDKTTVGREGSTKFRGNSTDSNTNSDNNDDGGNGSMVKKSSSGDHDTH